MDASLKVSVRNLEVTDQSTAVVTVDGEEVVRFPVVDKSGKFDRESDSARDFVTLNAGQVVKVAIAGSVLLTGELYED